MPICSTRSRPRRSCRAALVIVGDGPLRARSNARASATAWRTRPLSRRPPRPGRSPLGDGYVRAAVAVGRAAAVDGAGDGRGAAGRGTAVAGIPEVVSDGAPACSCRPRMRRRSAARSPASLRRSAARRAGAAARAFVLPRFGVERYVAPSSRCTSGCWRRSRVKLAIVYHMPFWRSADGALSEAEGSFARYVDSLAPYFDEIVLCVPVRDRGRHGTRDRARTSGWRRCRTSPVPGSSIRSCPRCPAAARDRAERRSDQLPRADAGGVVRIPRAQRAAAGVPARRRRLRGCADAAVPRPQRACSRPTRLGRAGSAAWRERLTFANGRALADKHGRRRHRARNQDDDDRGG